MSGDHDHPDLLQREAYDWLALFLRGDATSADLEAVKSWYARSPAHAEAYARARHLWNSLGPAIANETVGQEGTRSPEAAKNIGVGDLDAVLTGPVARRQISRHQVSRRAVLGGAMAASVAAATGYALVDPPFGLWPSVAQLSADFRTKTGEQRKIAFGDDVSLDLNTQTSIALRAADTNPSARHIELISGEAMISVSDRSLIVSAAEGRTIADRASFNLRYDQHAACVVTCLEGTITVERGSQTVSLGRGQQVSYDANKLGAVAVIDREAVTAWQRGVLIFAFTPVAQVVEEVNRYRPGRLVLLNEALGRRILNARFDIKDADKVVGQIARIFGAKTTFLPGGVVILT
jgi:transmembrane sensor